MEHLQLTQKPVAKAEMLIRRPVAEVFEAFVNPAMTTKFWFTKSSGRLEPGKEVQWEWEMYQASSQVKVKAMEEQKRLLIEWSGSGSTNVVEWLFTALEDDTTFVSITNSGFSGTGDELVTQALGSTQAFTLVLCGLKALLEHNIILNLVADRFPKGLEHSY
jgi:uncharacterized protein YndB with AHSA1/START domain